MKNTTILLSLVLLVLSMAPARADVILSTSPLFKDLMKPKPQYKYCECLCITPDFLILSTADAHRPKVLLETDCRTCQPIAGQACHGYTDEDVEIMGENQRRRASGEPPLESPLEKEGNYMCGNWTPPPPPPETP